MKPGNLRGALLEYLVRQLLIKCGFTNVSPDRHYVYENQGLLFINGKGAAHDADVLMNPPVQMPFTYPSRLLFECKAYSTSVGLDVIRNALGLRYDINEFEIVTDQTIALRRNNRRATYAISGRKRFTYQIGVASAQDFSKPAFEFAANNKIPLLSLRWFLPKTTCDLFKNITEEYINQIGSQTASGIFRYLKDKGITFLRDVFEYESVNQHLENDEVIGRIIRSFEDRVGNAFVALIETGDIIFLFASDPQQRETINQMLASYNLRAQLKYNSNEPNKWYLLLTQEGNSVKPELFFYVPNRIMEEWKEYDLSRGGAINMKMGHFSRIFIFTGSQSDRRLPFTLVRLDERWLMDSIYELYME